MDVVTPGDRFATLAATSMPDMLQDAHELKGAGHAGRQSAAATLAVGDLEQARDFYENTLGLPVLQEVPGAILYKSGELGRAGLSVGVRGQ